LNVSKATVINVVKADWCRDCFRKRRFGPVATITLPKRFLISVPATTNTLGAVDSIDPKAMTVVSHYTVNCSPAGLALGPIQRVMTSCGALIDGRNGNRLAIVSGPGGDEIWFNPGDNRYYFGANPMYVVDAETNQVVTSVTVGSTHALAVDSNNNHVFVPVTGAGIKVYSAQ
jgi:hypothetical protein